MNELNISAAVENLDTVIGFVEEHLEEYGCPMKTQMQVASEVGISQAQVSRLEKNSIKQIKKSI